MPAHRILATLLLTLAGTLAPAIVQADELEEIGRQLRNGQQSIALDRINSYLKSNPADAKALLLKGVALSSLNKREEAIQTFSEIIRKYPKMPEPYNNLAVLYAEQGQYEKARLALETALKTHPSYATAHNNLAGVYAYMASEAYDKALQLDKNKPRTTAGKLAMISDLHSAGTPTLVASRTQAEQKAMAPVKVAEVPQPSQLEEPNQQAESSKPVKVLNEVEPAKTAGPAKLAEPSKSMATLDTAATEKPSASDKTKNNPPVAVKMPAAEPEAKKTADSKPEIHSKVKASVEAWALAWSSQNVEKYLSSYADSFETPNGESRKQWEETRRERLTRPGTIKVDISGLRITMENQDRARASFKQTYRSGSNVMRTNKTLVLRNASGKWLIEQERTRN
ncbi:MAG TPA: tetratricopeptide repeat protein [Methylophilaceae bacterium]|nr:tetratricopeptide repeat protein [Methylophilaceae bacterium]